MNEKQLQSNVIHLAKITGWRVVHHRAAPIPGKSGRFVTPSTGDSGFPDLVLVRDGRLVFVELKSERGRLSPGQMAWIHELRQVETAQAWREKSGCVFLEYPVSVHVWRPEDWRDGTITAVLQRDGAR